MKCNYCNGTGTIERLEAFSVADIVMHEKCKNCNGTGEMPVTNDEWRKTCSTEEFAEYMAQYCCDVNTSDVKEILKNEWLDWLKQPHAPLKQDDCPCKVKGCSLETRQACCGCPDYFKWKEHQESGLFCLQVFQIDLTKLTVKLVLDPNGYKCLGDLPLEIGDDDMVLVVQSFGTGEHDNAIKMYMISKAAKYSTDIEVRLYRKLKELGLTRFDVFCSMSKGFKDRIKPMLKPIAGFDKYLYCKL